MATGALDDRQAGARELRKARSASTRLDGEPPGHAGRDPLTGRKRQKTGY